MVRQWTDAVFRRLVYPAVVAARGEAGSFSRLRALEELQWADPEVLLRRQGEALVRLLRHAAHHSPFFRTSLANAAMVRADEAMDYLATLPLIQRDGLQQHAREMRVRTRERVVRKVTGGSTGAPVTVFKNASAIAAERAASWLGYGWFGLRPGDRGARLWGSPTTARRAWAFLAADFAMHRIRLSAFGFDDKRLEVYWKRCQRFRPRYLYGYVSMLEEFARFLQRRGHAGREFGLAAVISTSEVLTEPQRRLLESEFGAPVQNEYGCGEVGPIAYECPEGSLHVMSENLVIELVGADGRPAREGEAGEVVLTDLNNTAMPLLRYRVGDLALWGRPCACGRGFPTLARVWGRAYDFVVSREGRRYHGEFFMYLFEDLRTAGVPLAKFQVRQINATDLIVTLVAPADRQEAVRDAVSRAFQARLPDFRVEIAFVEAIPRTASGKSVVVSNDWRSGGGGTA